ncbi:MAG: NADP-dependent oxidoreductase [Syntrophobacterales bacterium]|jgi:NADPH:quinone reductase-like Zn-dependent oxidoreductase|nr:NADP-dependent oxidoreductase [Syntrophobacterales bacterium]
MAKMQAVRFHSYGAPEVLVLEEAPRPQAGAGEVLLRVHAAGVNPLDWKVRAGHLKEWLPHRLPLIPGWDVSGVVEAVGPEVTAFKTGEAVYGMLDFNRQGAYAEYVAARTGELARKPRSIDHIQAAAVPLAALTAWQALFEVAGLAPWHTVLIHAAAGGVGHFAVQLAKWKGAKVIGTASAGNASFLRELGADEVIDYRSTRFEEAVGEVDVVLDTMGGDTQQRSWKVLKKGGILVATLGISSPVAAREHEVRGQGVSVHADAAQLIQIAALIDAGDLKPAVTAVLPLAEAARAHELSQAGHVRGKIVLQVGN